MPVDFVPALKSVTEKPVDAGTAPPATFAMGRAPVTLLAKSMLPANIAFVTVVHAGSVPAVVRTVLAEPIARRSLALAPRFSTSPRVVKPTAAAASDADAADAVAEFALAVALFPDVVAELALAVALLADAVAELAAAVALVPALLIAAVVGPISNAVAAELNARTVLPVISVGSVGSNAPV